MESVIVFAGTTEGRTLSEELAAHQVWVTACVATEYGETLLQKMPYLQVHTGRMKQEEMEDFLRAEAEGIVVDATHPYAVEVSKNILEACKATGKEYIRLIRESSEMEAEDAVLVGSVEEAIEYLKGTTGNILAATGSKELFKYTELPDYKERVFARVLSTGEVACSCEKLGFCGKHLICMQGPFSEELNIAMLRQFDCKYLVTKETGKAGGFEEKISAAKRADAKVVLIGRPAEQKGYSYQEVKSLLMERLLLDGDVLKERGVQKKTKANGRMPEEKRNAAEMAGEAKKQSLASVAEQRDNQKKRMVTLIGIGMGTLEGMTIEASKALEDADVLIGAKRMLAVAGESGKPVYTDYDAGRIADFIAAHPEYIRPVILLSGDIGFYSGAKRLYDALANIGCEVHTLCGISSVVYFCAKLHLAWEDVCLKSAHGRLANIVGAVATHAKTFVILSAANSVEDLCRELQEYGLYHVQVHIGERLGYPEERITSGTPAEMKRGIYDGLCVALIENPGHFPGTMSCIDDNRFLRGKPPMTKSEIRCLSVAKLHLTRDAVVYDVGAGTGSVTVEMALQAVDGMVYAIERQEEACWKIGQNKREFKTPNVQIVKGHAPEALEDLPAPTHAFIGGSAGNLKAILSCLLQKNPALRIVINTVTLETIGEVTECLKELPLIEEEIVSVSVAKANKLGKYHLMMGQNPIYIITCKGGVE